MPDIGKLLWPKSVAVVGASSDTHGLRGRIFEIIRSHPYAGNVYPVSRSAAEVQGVKAYASVEALPERVDLAILIVPAAYVPAELERCGRAASRPRPFSVRALPRRARRALACSTRSLRPRSAMTWR